MHSNTYQYHVPAPSARLALQNWQHCFAPAHPKHAQRRSWTQCLDMQTIPYNQMTILDSQLIPPQNRFSVVHIISPSLPPSPVLAAQAQMALPSFSHTLNSAANLWRE